jgi:hypothetical protein
VNTGLIHAKKGCSMGKKTKNWKSFFFDHWNFRVVDGSVVSFIRSPTASRYSRCMPTSELSGYGSFGGVQCQLEWD